MNKLITFLAVSMFVALPLFAEDEQPERILVVKPVMTTRVDTPTDWGGFVANASADPRYQMTKVADYENLYSCTISLKQYCKSNKWKGSYGEYPPSLPLNEGWAETHQFVVVYQDAYGDQENKDNPNAAAGAQPFLVPEDDTEITFYAVVESDEKIRSYCDAQAFTINTFNNAAGNIVFPAAIGKTSSVTAHEIGNSDNKKLELQANNHVLRPDGLGGGNKYAVYTRGRHAFTMDFLGIQYNIYKVADTIQSPKIRFGTETPIAAETLPADLGIFPQNEFPALGGMITAVSKTSSTFDANTISVSLHYEITPADETVEPIVGSIALASPSVGNQTSAIFSSEGEDIVSELPLGQYALKVWFETDSYGDILVNDNNEGLDYATAFTLEVPTGIVPAYADDAVATEYYNLQGVRVATGKSLQSLVSGVYIVKKIYESGAERVSKTVIK
ncbi:MAG: hypothetical protein LBS25_08785 [Candidatus Symbiothrix sp.]|jgi:hypothetical protein|nr:hypothetical protein [Candidatus Symbiothrix sp.]